MSKNFIKNPLHILTFVIFIIVSVSMSVYVWSLYPPPPLSRLIAEIVAPQDTPQNLLQPMIVYGYLPYWNREVAQFPKSLTHASYFSIEIQADGSLLDIPKAKQDNGYRLFDKGVLTNLRNEIDPLQKLELTISMLDQEAIPLFMSDVKAREKTLTDLRTILSEQPISGINIDVEYNGEVTEELQVQFAEFMASVQTILKKNNPPQQLSIALYADAASIPRLADPQKIAPHVDHLIIMAYDFHRRSSPRAGPVAPLFGGNEKKWESDIVQTLKNYTSIIPAEKIILGIPFYGYEWSVTGTDPQSFTLPKSGSTATYKRVKELIEEGTGKVYWDELALSPYLLYEDEGQQQLIYFEDSLSLSYKLDLVKQSGLGGIAIWALGYEGETQELWNTIETKFTSP